MKNKNFICFFLCIFLSFSLMGCKFQDDYILVTKQNEDEVPSSEKVDDIFDSDKVKELEDKLKDKPAEIANKLDDMDEDKERIIKEFTDKADELTDKLNEADLQGKSEDVKKNMEELTDKLDELKDKTDDVKDKIEEKKDDNIIDETKVSDIKDDFNSHIDNLQKALNRLGNH
ncbi:hypothetical protein [Clostridium sp. CTA-5]